MKEPFLQIKNITIQFNDQIIIKDFSLTLEKGEKLILTGHSGCGKSTIIKAILGFIPIDDGEIIINGTSLNEGNCWELRQFFAYVCQAPFTGFGTAEEFLMSPFNFKANRHIKFNGEKVHEYMQMFNLKKELLYKSVDELSGGEKQRFAIIGALLLEKEVLLLDEPTAALDKRNRLALNNFLYQNDEFSAIMITHDDDCIKNASKIIEITGEGK